MNDRILAQMERGRQLANMTRRLGLDTWVLEVRSFLVFEGERQDGAIVRVEFPIEKDPLAELERCLADAT